MDNRPFNSLDELEQAHGELVKLLGLTIAQAARSGSAPPTRGEIERKFLKENLEQVRGFVARGSATGMLLTGLNVRMPAQRVLDYWGTKAVGAGLDLGFDSELAEFDLSAAPDLEGVPCPYVGLNAFSEQDRDRFFGREQRIENLIELLHVRPIVFVTGSSGSGKSSLVLAGLLPALRDAALRGGDRWDFLPVVIPGADPVRSLANALAVRSPHGDPESMARVLAADSSCASRIFDASQERALLVVDQFEEVFTLRTPETAQRFDAFVANLLELAAKVGTRHRIVVTFRKDREGDLANNAALQELYFKNQFIVSAMLPGQLRDAIEKPAEHVGLKFDDGVVEELVKGFTGDEAALPLLQFCLVELWNRKERNRVRMQDYRALGDPKYAMATVADDVYAGFAEQDRKATRTLFLALAKHVQAHEYVRDRRVREHLWGVAGNKQTVDYVLEELEKRRLLRVTRSGDDRAKDTVEVAHEALLRNWTKFTKWASEEAEPLRQRAFITDMAERWLASVGRSDSASTPADGRASDTTGLLLGGLALEQAMEQLYQAFGEGSIERRFLDESKRKAEYLKNELSLVVELQKSALESQNSLVQLQNFKLEHQRIRSWFLVIVIVLGAVAGFKIYDKSLEIEEVNRKLNESLGKESNRAELETRKSGSLQANKQAAEALHACEEDTDRAIAKIALVRRVVEKQSLPIPADAVAAAYCMMRTQARSVRHLSPVPDQAGDVKALAMTGDGHRLATASGPTAKEWNLEGSIALHRVIPGPARDLKRAEHDAGRLGDEIPVSALAYDPKGLMLAVGYGHRSQFADEPVLVAGRPACPDRAAACGKIALWPVGADKPILQVTTGAISHLAFNTRAKRFAALSWEVGAELNPQFRHMLRVWDTDRPDTPIFSAAADGGRGIQLMFSGGDSAISEQIWLINGDGSLTQYVSSGTSYRKGPTNIEHRCPLNTSFAFAPGRFVLSEQRRICVFNLHRMNSDDLPDPIRPDSDDRSVRDLALRGQGGRFLATLTGRPGEIGDIRIRDLHAPEREPTVLRRYYDLDSQRGNCHVPLRSEPSVGWCDDFESLLQMSDDGKRIALKRSRGGIRIIDVTDDPTLGWWRKLDGQVVLSEDGKRIAVLAKLTDGKPAPAGRARAGAARDLSEFQVRIVDPMSAKESASARLLGFVRPVLRMLSNKGDSFVIEDVLLRKVQNWRVGNDAPQTIQNARFVSGSEDGALFVVSVSRPTPSCAVYRLGADAPVLTMDGGRCALSESGRYAAAQQTVGSEMQLLVYDLREGSGKRRWSMPISGKSLHRVSGTEKPLVILIDFSPSEPARRSFELIEVGELPRSIARYQVESPLFGSVRIVESRGLAVVVQAPGKREIYDVSAAGTEPIARNVLAISASGRHVAIHSDTEIEIRDMSTRKRLAGIPHGDDETDRIERIVFSANDTWMGAIGNKRLTIYRLPDATLFVALPRQQANDVVFGTQGDYMLVKSGEREEYEVLPLRLESIYSAVSSKLSKSAAGEISACLDGKRAEACTRLGLPDHVSSRPKQ